MSYEYIESPNKSSRRGHQVSGLIAHFTNGGLINGTVRYLANKIKVPKSLQGSVGRGYVTRDGVTYYNARAAAHYITGRTGRTVRMVPENMAAWHAGSSTTKPKLNGRGSLNYWTIGHEICNWGPLREKDGKFYTSASNWTHPYDGPVPEEHIQRIDINIIMSYLLPNGYPAFPSGIIKYWEPYTIEQIDSIVVLWSELVDRYSITEEWVAGHEDVDPTRKIDPGPAFPWQYVKGNVFQKQHHTENSLLEADTAEINAPVGEQKLSVEQQVAERSVKEDRSESNICKSILRMFNS